MVTKHFKLIKVDDTNLNSPNLVDKRREPAASQLQNGEFSCENKQADGAPTIINTP